MDLDISATVATDLNVKKVTPTDGHDINKGKTKVVDIHSHPDGGEVTVATPADMKTAKPGVKNAIYHKGSEKLYEYNGQKTLMPALPANTDQEILKYIRNGE